MQLSKGKYKDHTLADQGPVSVQLSMLWVTMQVGKTWLSSPRAGDVNPLQPPRARAFSINLLNVGHQYMQWVCEVGCPVWTLRTSSCFFPPRKGPLTSLCSAVAVNGTKTLVNTWGRNRRSPGNPAQPSAHLIMVHQAHSAPFSPLLPPMGYFVLPQVLESLQTFFFTQPVTFWSGCPALTSAAAVNHWLGNSSKDSSSSGRMAGSTCPPKLAHTKNNTQWIAEWFKEKCFNFTAINRNIHYSTVYSGVNRTKPNGMVGFPFVFHSCNLILCATCSWPAFTF